jgi:hypothetical protein
LSDFRLLPRCKIDLRSSATLREVIKDRRFGKTSRSDLQGQEIFPEMSVPKYQSNLRTLPEGRISHDYLNLWLQVNNNSSGTRSCDSNQILVISFKITINKFMHAIHNKINLFTIFGTQNFSAAHLFVHSRIKKRDLLKRFS